MASVELHTGEVAPVGDWRLGREVGWPWCQLRLCLETNGNQKKTLKDLSRGRVGLGFAF